MIKTKNAQLLLWFAPGVMAISYVDRQVLAVLAPSVTADLGLSDSAYGLIASCFSIAYLVGAPLAGVWLDRVGVFAGLAMAVVVWSLVASAHGLAMGLGSLCILRVLLGLTEAPSFPGAVMIVRRALPTHLHSRGMGWLFTGSSIGAVVAPPLASWVAIRAGWRPAFAITSTIGLVWLACWVVWGRSLTLVNAESEGKLSLQMVLRKFKSVLCQPHVRRGVKLMFGAAPMMAFMLVWGAKLLVSRLHLSQAQLGFILWIPPLSYDVGSILFGELGGRYPGFQTKLGMIACGLALSAVGLLGCSHLGTTVFVMGLSMVGTGGMYALLTARTLATTKDRDTGAVSGVIAGAQSVSQTICHPLIGWSVDLSGGYQWALMGLAIGVLFSLYQFCLSALEATHSGNG